MEKNNPIDFRELWNKQVTPVPNQEDIINKINKHKASGLRKIVFLNVCLILTILVVVLVWIYFQPQFLSTKVGIVLIILSIVIFLFVNNKTIPLYKRVDETQSNNQYLSNILKIKNKEHFLQTRMLNLYFILLSLGLGLYMYEYTSRMSLLWGIVTYGVVTLWFAFNWFILRPRQIKRNRQKIEQLVYQLEKIKDRLDEV